MNLKKFFLYSVVFHAFIVAALIFLLPAPGGKKSGGEFFADLVSPEELRSRPLIMPRMPGARPVPPPAPRSVAPSVIKKGTVRPEKGLSYDQEIKYSGRTKDTMAVPPSTSIGNEGQGISGETGMGPAEGGESQKPDRDGPIAKEKLFDKNIIGDLAIRNIEKEEKRDKTFSFDAKEYRFLIYNRRLKERIEGIWHYPADAAAHGIYGDLIIRFTIKKSGQLGAVELVRTSGHKSLDDAAMEALREGAPYWPLPQEWGMEAYTIEGHFIYTLYGYYIR